MQGIYLRLGAAFVVSLIVVLGSYEAGAYYAAHSMDSTACLGALGETSACWTNYYESLVVQKGAVFALHDLQVRYESKSAAATFCHPLLHIIGGEAAREFGSVSAAFARGETFCRSGYYHGVLEGLFGEEDKEALVQNLDALCAPLRKGDAYTYDYFSCVHGIGHGLMTYFNHDLVASLEGCRTLSGEWEQSSCYGGVFMENVISDTPEEPSRYLRHDDLLFPCTAVDDVYREQCYLMQSSHVLSVLKGDFKKTFAVCARVEEKYRTTCFESIGRDASGWSYGSSVAVHAYCLEGETLDERSACLVGAAVDYIQSVGPAEALSVCSGGEEEARERCLDAVKAQIRAL